MTISNVKAENGSEVAVELAYQAAKDADIPTITLASGDTFEKTEEGVLVAQVGETKYTSIDEALTAALSAEDHTLTLLQDVTKDISIAAGSTLTIEQRQDPVRHRQLLGSFGRRCQPDQHEPHLE